MIIKVSGMLIDKFEQTSRDKNTGQEKKSLKAVIYQKESHQTMNITIETATFTKLEPFKEVTLNCELGTFVSNGKAIQYFKEVA